MTVRQTTAPVIPPRARPGAPEHGRPAVVRRLPVARCAGGPGPGTCCTGSGGWIPRAGSVTGP
jgi:hypothetical protein